MSAPAARAGVRCEYERAVVLGCSAWRTADLETYRGSNSSHAKFPRTLRISIYRPCAVNARWQPGALWWSARSSECESRPVSRVGCGLGLACDRGAFSRQAFVDLIIPIPSRPCCGTSRDAITAK